jgi:hypothetical protein
MDDKPGERSQDQKDRREALLKEYSEIGSNFRALTDIRFRLIQLLPLASLAVTAVGALKPTDGNGFGSVAFALFGLVVTLILVTYNKRNDQLYDALVDRAAAVERELGVPDGAFANRPTSWLAYGLRSFHWSADHRSAIFAVYLATAAFWLFLVLEACASPAVDARRLAAVAVALVLVAAWLMKRQEDARLRSVKLAVKSAFRFDLMSAITRVSRTSPSIRESSTFSRLRFSLK